MGGGADRLLTVPSLPHVLINRTKKAIMQTVPLQEAAQPRRQGAAKTEAAGGDVGTGITEPLPPIPETWS